MFNNIEGRSPKFNENGSVSLEINHPNFGWIPFTASKDDCEAHGRAIYQSCINGEYGEISEYIAPILPTKEEIEAPIKEAILALNPTAKFPTDADANSDGVATIEELKAYLKLLQEKALIAKFEG